MEGAQNKQPTSRLAAKGGDTRKDLDSRSLKRESPQGVDDWGVNTFIGKNWEGS